MTVWLLRFVPYNGGSPVDACFSSAESASKQWNNLVVAMPGDKIIVDDFGLRVRIDPSKGALILTDTETSAKSVAALDNANKDAQSKTKQIGSIPKAIFGSTLQ